MSMQDLPDSELDKLFRKSAEEFEPPFNPQAWKAMRKKLEDEDDKVGGFAWWKTGVVAVLLLTMGIAGYFLYNKSVSTTENNQSQNQSVTSQQQLRAEVTTSSEKNVIAANITPQKQDEAAKSSNNIETSTSTNQIAAINQSITTNNSLDNALSESRPNPIKNTSTPDKRNESVLVNSSKNKFIFHQKSKRQSLPQLSSSNTDLTQTPKQQNGISLAIDSSNSTAPAYFGTSLTKEENSRFKFLNLNTLPIQGWKFLQLNLPMLAVVYNPPPSALFIPKKEIPSSFFRKGLGVRAIIAPDLSYITMNQMMQQPTLALGILLDYRFSKRWSMQAGAIKTVKLYHATGEQYHWPDSWSGQKARPIDISAECKILDIPINFRYDMSQGNKSRWFATTGVSNYIMLNEKYNYTYPPNSYNIKWKTWEGTTGNYWLGVLNISMGFERQIGRNWSFQAEPYLKMPLAQVGMGKVMLSTSGVYISARYRLGHF